MKDHRQKRNADAEDCPQSNCSCPQDGINSNELICSCQFFACLDEGRNLMPVFEGFTGLECLAFILDTTGSMKDEIDVTLQAIKDFIASEELGCYLLVPFNDDGNPQSSVGPSTLTYVDDYDPNSIPSLQNLIRNLENAFQKKSGGDCPEYSYDGIIKALNTEDYGVPVMASGSQLIVITDAPSKGDFKASDIILQANSAEVCIHFFLGERSYNCFDEHSDAIEDYENIANQTGGIVVKSKFDFSTFVHQYKSAPCGFLQTPSVRKKRSSQVCHSINVASLVCLLSLSVRAEEPVMLIKPGDNQTTSIRPKRFRDTSEQIAHYVENQPMPGEWTVCANSPIQVSVDFQMCIDIAPFYVTNTKEGKPILTATTAPGCTMAHSIIVSTRSADMYSPVLSVLDRRGNTALEADLETCGGSLSANFTMPSPGMYYYKLSGEDVAGNRFDHIIQRKITVLSGANFYGLKSVGPGSVQVALGQVAVLRFQFSSTNPFGPVRFNFTLAENGFPHQVSPSQFDMVYGLSINVTVRIRPLISQGVTLVVTNNCFNLTAERSITISQPVTTAPPPASCNPQCQNGGTCVVIRRRRREFHVCRCPPGYYGRGCENVRS